LKPIKRKQLIDLTAEQLNISKDIVDDVVTYYYQTVQKKLSLADHHSVVVPRLGTFTVKKKSLEQMILKHQRFVAKIEQDEHISVKTYELIIQKRAEIERLTKLQERMAEENARKEEVKLKKQIYQDGKLNQNLEESQSDS
jgi:transcription initiation factor TFIIIB Brf1 subunit/transcription initiation factor TFIIB